MLTIFEIRVVELLTNKCYNKLKVIISLFPFSRQLNVYENGICFDN